MSRTGTALYMTLGILITFTIFSSVIKTFVFSAGWFKPDDLIFPIVFYAALIDFIVLIVLYTLIHNVRFFPAFLHDDSASLAGLAGVLVGWIIAKTLAVILPFLNANGARAGAELAEKPGFEGIMIVAVTLIMIVISRELLIRGFLFQYLAKGAGERTATWVIPLSVALFSIHFEHYGWIEFVNIFLFNMILCLCFRMFHDLWLSSALSFTLYFSAFFMRLPVRELGFVSRANLLTGLEKSWFGTETTVFAGLPLTVILTGLVFLMHAIVTNKPALPIEDSTEPPEKDYRHSRLRAARDQDYWHQANLQHTYDQ